MIYSKPEEQNDFGEFQKKFHSFIFRVPLKNKQELIVMDLILWPSSLKSNFRVWQRLKSVFPFGKHTEEENCSAPLLVEQLLILISSKKAPFISNLRINIAIQLGFT